MIQYALRALVGTVVASVSLAWSTHAPAEEQLDACKLLKQADVEAAFAPRKFDAGTAGKAAVKSSPQLAAVSQCTYTSSGATAKDRITVSLLARRAPSDTSGVTPQAAKTGAIELKATPVDIAGLGDGAYTVNMGSAAFPVIQVNVFRGKRDWFVFACAAMKMDPNGAVAGLKKIAATTLARQ
jgi:hypothetical protein